MGLYAHTGCRLGRSGEAWSGQDATSRHTRRESAFLPALFIKSHIVRTITLRRLFRHHDPRFLGRFPKIGTLPAAPRRAFAPTSVAATPTPAVILHHQPELPGLACDRASEPPGLALPDPATRAEPQPRAGGCRPPSVPAGRLHPWLTARAEVSSDDLAVTRHALTAVAEVKVRA
ncbi:hypothetical protein GCM10012278_00300 [Nonomuraea glycinis]|uniref:Uncharacterized protein n=1 Tax=Nonomuraea glycinis TaxID=2047744 RepID=A0A917ZZI8_9ACTN|nr:hypothetical protein GCM10012278_00300 [Nonomuraea glycinis]